MRRCMTPNPHTKTQMLNQLVGDQLNVKQPQFNIDYDNFIFVDRITNHRIAIGEAKNRYGVVSKKNTINHQSINPNKQSKKAVLSSRNKTIETNREIQQINECWNFMKTTKLFQMDSLKNKLFAKNSEDVTEKDKNCYENMHKKKKNLRDFIEQYVHDINIRQFRKYAQYPPGSEQRKQFNQKVINLWKHVPSKISRQNIGLIIEQILSSEEKSQPDKKYKNITLDDINFPGEDRLQRMLMNRALIKHKQFQHLIAPKDSKKRPMTSQINYKSKVNRKNQFKYQSQIQNLRFTDKIESEHLDYKNQNKQNQIKTKQIPDNQNIVSLFCRSVKKQIQKIPEKDKKIPKQMANIHKNLIMAAQNGLIYDLLFLLIRWPRLLYCVDKRGNNLLHTAAKKNQIDIYDILLKKMGKQSLAQKNKHSKTPIQLAKLFNSVDIIKRNQQLQVYIENF